MKIEKGQRKLEFFQDLYQDAVNKSERWLNDLSSYEAQYNGSKEIDNAKKDAEYCRNVTFELIESQVSTYIPPAKVTPARISKTNIKLAQMIERYLHNVVDKLPFEVLNDIDERMTYIYGGSVWLIEWDNTITTSNCIGSPNIRILDPKMFVPQPAVYDVKEMEYLFVKYIDTHENLTRKYGVSFEKAKETSNEDDMTSDDTCTVVNCFYRDDNDLVCKYVWADDVELEDREDYWGRKIQKCKNCGKISGICECDNPEFIEENLEYEEITRPMEFFDGLKVIAPETPVIKDGVPQLESTLAPITVGGIPAMEEVGGTLINMTSEQQVVKTKKTKIPFYKPSLFPIVVRKNISELNNIFGQSDCKFIRDQQQAINKLESRINEKSLKSGVVPISGRETKFELTEEILENGVKVSNLQEKEMLGVLDFRVDTTRDESRSEKIYQDGKRILGISDSFQGMPDKTAQSGIAKQISVMQSGGRVESKRVMKSASYAEKYEIIFQLSLAFSDQPRPISYLDVDNQLTGEEFNKYAFLELDKAGEWYYNDEFLFSTDKVSDIGRNRELMWQETRNNFQMGAFGDPQDIDTLIFYWQTMENLHYPNAAQVAERFIQKKEQIIAQQAQMPPMIWRTGNEY